MKLKHLGQTRLLAKNDHKLHKSYEERIARLKIQLEKLEKLKKINDYFKRVSRHRNSYVVEMRRIVAMDLFAEGHSVSEVTRALHKTSHATIIHLKTIENFKHIKEEVANNYQKWIKDKVYPFTYNKADIDPVTKIRSVKLAYRLNPI